MRIHNLKIIAVLLVAFAVSGCGNTFRGMGEDVSSLGTGLSETSRDAQEWSHGKETELGGKIGEVPRAYAIPHYYDGGRRLTQPVTPQEKAAVAANTAPQIVAPPSPPKMTPPKPVAVSKPVVPPSWEDKPLMPVAKVSTPAAPAKLQPIPSGQTVQPVPGVIVNYDVLDEAPATAAPQTPDAYVPQPMQAAPGVMVYPLDPSEFQRVGGPVSEYNAPNLLIDSNGVQNMAAYNAGAGYISPFGGADETIFFKHGSARLGSLDKKKLKTVVQETAMQSYYGMQVVGHASKRVAPSLDPIRARSVNLQMSMLRAQAVTSELQKNGANPDWVEMSALGDTQPNLNPPPGKSQEAADRRVEVFVDSQ